MLANSYSTHNWYIFSKYKLKSRDAKIHFCWTPYHHPIIDSIKKFCLFSLRSLSPYDFYNPRSTLQFISIGLLPPWTVWYWRNLRFFCLPQLITPAHFGSSRGPSVVWILFPYQFHHSFGILPFNVSGSSEFYSARFFFARLFQLSLWYCDCLECFHFS